MRKRNWASSYPFLKHENTEVRRLKRLGRTVELFRCVRSSFEKFGSSFEIFVGTRATRSRASRRAEQLHDIDCDLITCIIDISVCACSIHYFHVHLYLWPYRSRTYIHCILCCWRENRPTLRIPTALPKYVSNKRSVLSSSLKFFTLSFSGFQNRNYKCLSCFFS